MKQRRIDLFGMAYKNDRQALFLSLMSIIGIISFALSLAWQPAIAANGEENATVGNIKKPIVVAPGKLPTVIIKQKGKDALQADYLSFPDGQFSLKTIPLAGLSAQTTQATVTCNNGVSSIDFDPHVIFEGVLDGCIAGKMPKSPLIKLRCQADIGRLSWC